MIIGDTEDLLLIAVVAVTIGWGQSAEDRIDV